MIWKKKFEIYDSFYHFRLRPEVTVDVLNPIVFAYIERSIFGISFIFLCFTVSEKKGGQDDFLKNVNRPYLTTGSEFWKNKKNVWGYFHSPSSLKISRKSIKASLRNLRNKKRGKKERIIIIITRNSLRVMRRSSVTQLPTQNFLMKYFWYIVLT